MSGKKNRETQEKASKMKSAVYSSSWKFHSGIVGAALCRVRSWICMILVDPAQDILGFHGMFIVYTRCRTNQGEIVQVPDGFRVSLGGKH